MNKKSRYGFTFVEILIVIAIFSLLTSITILGVVKMREISRDSVMCTQLRVLYKSAYLMFIEKGYFPSNIKELVDKKYFAGDLTVANSQWVVMFNGLELGLSLSYLSAEGVRCPKVWAVSDSLSYGHGESWGLWRGNCRSKSPWLGDCADSKKSMDYLVNREFKSTWNPP